MVNGWSDSSASPAAPVIPRRTPAPSSLLELTEAERLALQKIALSRLEQSDDMDCQISIPKGTSHTSEDGAICTLLKSAFAALNLSRK